eukprot:6911828-Prymnesium_polylepis.1
MLLVISRLDSSTWRPAGSTGIARGEQRPSIRARQRVSHISSRSASPPEHIPHVSDLPRCCPARPQLVWSVARATLVDALLVSVSPRLVRGDSLGSDCDPGLSGYLRIALRMRLSALFARYGRRSERCRVIDGVRVCRSCGDAAPRALECIRGSRCMLPSDDQSLHMSWYYHCACVVCMGGASGASTYFISTSEVRFLVFLPNVYGRSRRTVRRAVRLARRAPAWPAVRAG